ncbi:cucumber peeling cupredoxin-like [Cucurbita maxima]|uniref:Cucumber peeling cupredoxin-like n=1 Tax=Cucurbita maxima TaxID=3661 RepID=A0A6J1JI19_CUCMA|nr:cucumber peeling cupredoxin-like [Cucurbita maxima]
MLINAPLPSSAHSKNIVHSSYMGSTRSSFLASLLFIGALLQAAAAAAAVDHRVGGDFGWNLPPTPTFFSEWASNTSFSVGDTLRFNSSANQTHNYGMPESQAEFDGCVKPGIFFENVIFVTFDRPARKYFICNVGNHCKLGMKFAVDVLPNPGMPPNSALKIGAFPTLFFIATAILPNFLFFI